MTIKYFGELTIPENNMNEITYVLLNKKLNRSFNLTKYLKQNQGKEIGLVISKYGTDIFCEVGIIEVISEVLMVNGRDISNTLWSNTNTILTIIVDDMEEVL